MALPFDPVYSSNAFDGTDVRNGNGELKGFTSLASGGKFRARLSDGLVSGKSLGEFANDQAAITAILLSYT